MKKYKSDNLEGQVLDVLPDSADFRDFIYRPALIQLKRTILPKKQYIRVRDQEKEGACTGFGLAAVIDYLNYQRAKDKVIDSFAKVSTRMLYEMARLHDRWPGEDYEGSSARGAMKGWHKHGVCGEEDWPYRPNSPGSLTALRQQKALQHPLGAYYRILPKRNDVQAALNEVGAIFVTAKVHSGWAKPVNGVIQHRQETDKAGHAFAILGYNDEGFIIQNSWGDDWGGFKLEGGKCGGLALWTYEDFDVNLMDAWVARMARPLESLSALKSGDIVHTQFGPKRSEKAPPMASIYHHYIHIDDGQFDPEGNYPSSPLQVREIADAAAEAKQIFLYAHGGLNAVKSAAIRTAAWRPVFARNGIFETHFIWETGLCAEFRDVLLGKQSFAEERAGGFGDWWDRFLEKSTWPLGRPVWREMITDAELAFQPGSDNGTPAGTETLNNLKAAIDNKKPSLHLVGHSAGAIWLAYLLERWHAIQGPAIENLILFAPACTHQLFKTHIVPRLKDKTVKNLLLFMLSDEREEADNVALIYRKSLLYLVSNSYQKTKQQLNGPSIPILGMERFNEELKPLISPFGKRVKIFISGQSSSTNSVNHGGFDNDMATMTETLKAILGPDYAPENTFKSSDLDYSSFTLC